MFAFSSIAVEEVGGGGDVAGGDGLIMPFIISIVPPIPAGGGGVGAVDSGTAFTVPPGGRFSTGALLAG